MVTLLKDYEQQTYFLNTGNDIDDIEFHNGDMVFLMDRDQLLIYDEGGNQWYPVPTGGGGGTAPTELKLLASGSYTHVSGGTMTIPVSITGYMGAVLVTRKDDPPNTNSYVEWCAAPQSVCEGMGNLSIYMPYGPGRQVACLGTTSIQSIPFRDNAVSLSIDARQNTSSITCNRPNTSFPILAGTYKWYIWGFEA